MTNLEKLDKTIAELEVNSSKLNDYADLHKELKKLKEDIAKNLANIKAIKEDFSKNLINAKTVNKELEGQFLLISKNLKDFQKKSETKFEDDLVKIYKMVEQIGKNQNSMYKKLTLIESQNKDFKKEIAIIKEKKKIVCSMMNESYGFGSYRNKIWLAQSQNLHPAYQKGYHKLFLPLVNYAKHQGITNKMIKHILEHIARHRTVDIWKERRGRRDLLGMFYRNIIEPICFLFGKF